MIISLCLEEGGDDITFVERDIAGGFNGYCYVTWGSNSNKIKTAEVQLKNNPSVNTVKHEMGHALGMISYSGAHMPTSSADDPTYDGSTYIMAYGFKTMDTFSDYVWDILKLIYTTR
ncbi:MAG: hypothetical protein ACOCP4_04020 [Candidatus Woesearchaeota archaeon]